MGEEVRTVLSLVVTWCCQREGVGAGGVGRKGRGELPEGDGRLRDTELLHIQ